MASRLIKFNCGLIINSQIFMSATRNKKKQGFSSPALLEDSPNSINQKNKPVRRGNRRKKGRVFFVNDYMKTIIKEKTNSTKYYCTLCPGEPEIGDRSVYRHILESQLHEDSITERHEEKHAEMVTLINKRINRNRESRSRTLQEPQAEDRDYLNFIGFCQKKNFSFSQISDLGQYLKNLAIHGRLRFVEKHTFTRAEISAIARSFGDFLLEELKNDLEKSPYSLSLDNSTVAKKQICALKVRYLKEFVDDQKNERWKLQSKIIGLKYLDESSDAKTLLEATQEKLLNLSTKVKENLVGIVHDHASSLSGMENGFGKLLKGDLGRYFMDLKDPCHSYNLALSKASKFVPEEMINFVEDIHNHFRSPQRVACLFKVQKKPLGLRHYARTRWLSLGQSLDRMLLIWDDLKEYMKKKPKLKSKDFREPKFEEFFNLLDDDTFKMKIRIWNSIVGKINAVNTRFQSQQMEIQDLKLEIHNCIWEIARLFIANQHLPQQIVEFNSNDWNPDNNSTTSKYNSSQQFIHNLFTYLDSSLYELEHSGVLLKDEMTKIFQPYLCKIFNLFLYYLPYKEEIIGHLDFVNVSPGIEIKVEEFNEKFKIVPKEKISFMTQELAKLTKNPNLGWAKSISKGSTLYLYDLLRNTFKKEDLKFIPRIFEIAHVLPTSSAGVEQSFSTLKLVRNVLRSNLKEETTQGLILIAQEFSDEGFSVTDKMVDLYKTFKKFQADKAKIRVILKKKDQVQMIEETKSNQNPKEVTTTEATLPQTPNPKKKRAQDELIRSTKQLKRSESIEGSNFDEINESEDEDGSEGQEEDEDDYDEGEDDETEDEDQDI